MLRGLLLRAAAPRPYVGPWRAAGLSIVVALASSEGWVYVTSVGLSPFPGERPYRRLLARRERRERPEPRHA